eukprot:gene737-61379_t
MCAAARDACGCGASGWERAVIALSAAATAAVAG